MLVNDVCIWTCTCYGVHVGIRGEFYGVNPLLLSLYGLQGLKLGWHACSASSLPAEPSLWPQTF